MGIYLRALEIEDCTITCTWRNDPEVTLLLGGNSYHVSVERERKWIENVIHNDLNSIRLGIVISEGNTLIGIVNLTSIEWINRKAEFSIMIGDKNAWGKGYGEEAANKIIEVAFKERNLQKLYLIVNVLHDKAIALYEKIGFVKEGLLKRDHFKNGSFQDVYIYSLFND